MMRREYARQSSALIRRFHTVCVHFNTSLVDQRFIWVPFSES